MKDTEVTPAEQGIKAAQQEALAASLEVGDRLEVTFHETYTPVLDYDGTYIDIPTGPQTLRGEILWTDGTTFVIADLDELENVGFEFWLSEDITIKKLEEMEPPDDDIEPSPHGELKFGS